MAEAGARRDLGYTAIRLVPIVISTAGTLLLARTLGVSEFGGYATALAVTQVITSIGLLGQDQLVLQAKLSIGAAALRGAIVVLVSSAFALGVGLLIVRPELYPVAVAVSGTAALMQWCSIPFAYLLVKRANTRRARAEVWLRTSYQAGLNGAGLWWGTAFAAAIGGLVGTVVGIVFVLSRIRRGHAVTGPTKSAGWLDGARYGLDGLIYSLALAVPVLVIAARGSEEQNAQARIVFLAYTAVVAISRSINGELYRAQLFATRDPDARLEIWRTMRKSLLVSGVATAGGLIVGAFLVRPVIGADYAPAGVAIAMLAAGVLLQFYGYGLSTLAITNGHVTASILRQALTLAASVVLSLTLPPGPIMLAIVLIAGDLLTTIFFATSRRRLA